MQISEGQARGLLDKTYGFQITIVNSGSVKHRVSWNWTHDGQVVVFNVVDWRVSTGAVNSYSSDRLAEELGLRPEDMVRARDGYYTRSCLQLVFLIHQLAHFIKIANAWNRQRVIECAPMIIEAIRTSPFEGACCDLLKLHRDDLDYLRAHIDADVGAIGRTLSDLIAPLHCW